MSLKITLNNGLLK